MPGALENSLLELVGEVFGLLEMAELRDGMLAALVAAVPCDWVSLNDVGPSPGETFAIVRPALAPRWHKAFARHVHQNPMLVHWLRTRDSRAYRFSDLASEEELRALDLFREVYEPLGLRYQIAFHLPAASDRVLAVALSRRSRDFNDRERDLLDRARPYLTQAYRNALAYERASRYGPSAGGTGQVSLLRGEGLTARQAEIVSRIARGASNAEIASDLGIGERTVQTHLRRAYRRLGVSSRFEAAQRVWALTQGHPPDGRPPVTAADGPMPFAPS